MTKAVLIMDMPPVCGCCKMYKGDYYTGGAGGECTCRVTGDKVKLHAKAETCPLRELPEERQSIREQTIEEFENAAIANIKMLYPGIRPDVGADKFIEWCKDNKSYIDCQNAVNLAALQLKGKGGNTDEK